MCLFDDVVTGQLPLFTGDEEPDSGMFVSSQCIVGNLGPGLFKLVVTTVVNPAMADGLIREGIESSVG